MEGHDEGEAKQEAFAQILPVFQKELDDVYMNNLAWMKALKKDPIHKKIMATREDYVNNNMFDPDEAIAVAVKKRNVFTTFMCVKYCISVNTGLHFEIFYTRRTDMTA